MFRSLSLSLTGIFIPLYMLKLGYPALDIIMIEFWYFFARFSCFDIFSGYLVSRIGPKHTILYGNFLLILSTTQFMTLPYIHWPIWLLGAAYGGSSSMFWVPFHTDFSKINHKEHGGKELGYVNIMSKIGGIFGPLVGGIVATLFGGQYIFLVAMILLVVSGMPLLRTAEPVPIHRKLNLSKINLGRMKPDILSYTMYGIDGTATGILWPLWLGIFVLVGGAAYAKLGALASISVVVSMSAAFTIGKLIDKHKGRSLLRFGATANSALHLFRPFITTYPGALLVNMANEGLTVTYQMPYTKGMYDTGDAYPERRAAYFTTMELLMSGSRLAFWGLLAVLTFTLETKTVLTVGFVIAAIASLLIMKEKYKALNRATL
jgi:MFS family permease